MRIRDTRAGFTQAKFNEDASSFVIFEILVLAVAFGIGMQSWGSLLVYNASWKGSESSAGVG